MSRNSNEQEQLLESLRRTEVHPSWLKRVNSTRLLTQLEQVSRSGESGSIPVIAKFLFSPSREVRRAACHAIARIVSALPTIELLQLSHVGNECSWYWCISSEWNELQPNQVSQMAVDQSFRAAILGLLSFHRNGYVRHKAVKLLDAIRDGSELPFLLIRQNDWVETIGADAHSAVLDRLNDSYVTHFIRNLPLVLHLRNYTRNDYNSIVTAVVEMLLLPESDSLFEQAVRSSSSKTRREIFRVALTLDGNQRARVVRIGLRSDDPVIRFFVVRRMRECLPADEWMAIIERLQNDRSMPIRREALTMEAEITPERGESVWRRALLDSHSSIRELAQFHLRKTAAFDIADVYRQSIAANGVSVPALYGLGETGTAADLATIRRYLSSELPSQRRAAVRGLSCLGKEESTAELIERLSDGSPSVVREASRALIPWLHRVDGQTLLSIVQKCDYDWSRTSALRLIDAKGKWDGMPWLIRAAVHREASVALLAQSFIARWIFGNRVFTKPSDSQRTAIRNAISAAKGELSESFLETLKDWLGAEYL